MESSRPRRVRAAIEDALRGERGLGLAVDAARGTSSDGRLYFCVIDRLCYGSLGTALIHVKMQHGVAAHGESLVRARTIGGGR